jgi:hypothetical protein
MIKRTPFVSLFLLAIVAAAIAYTSTKPYAGIPPEVNENSIAGKPSKTMRAFSSDRELKDFLAALAEKRARDSERRSVSNKAMGSADMAAASPSTLGAFADAKEEESVTNSQHAGVDEGGIVKVHGDNLVILRRGRLFTVRIGDNSLKPIAAVDAFAPGIDPGGDWCDEMLVSGDTVVVIGYSYARGGTEINLFSIDPAGTLGYRSTYHLRSNDYYSSRNYASRLIGSKLIFYTPQYLGYDGDPSRRFPAVRRWHKGATADEFRPIVEPTRVYRAEKAIESPYGLALHTVTVCDLANGGFACSATAVLGAPGRVFYVSPTSVYVWSTDWNRGGDGQAKADSMLYRMPLDASAPSALGVAGSPIDQFSFLESDDEHLNVLVRSDAAGEQMWGSEVAAGDVALLRAPLDSFSDGSQEAARHRYRGLPKPTGYTFQNRFVGDHILYGTGSGWGSPEQTRSANLFAVSWVDGDVDELWLEHGVDRIEQLGSDAVVVGTDGRDLHFSPVRLGAEPSVRKGFVRRNASQGELRSHGFFYRATGKNAGLLGLPVAREGRPGYRHLIEGSAAVVFLRNDKLELTELGELEAGGGSANDGCRASCVDWYGNARPLFLRNRVFALLGYEIVEGQLAGDRIRETRRINYSSSRRGRNGAE